ncbi:MAG: NAD-dependent epimerase/dehydratase family protein [Deltaproteobacteria bacterium]|jgi:UDP-glucuronate 4-epimerase|nr:NAD-dependent epimerase/dehydratase family protein [Deltaproteobacteria bacterium]MBW2536469.1 NAD-dependent epimerase/dehydratase family protein [Deltaproteobacteria bacterium]
MGKTIIVTGAAGFIGSHTVEALCGRGDAVVGMDSFSDYYSPARKRANLGEVRSGLASADAFRFVEGDVRSAETVGALLSEGSVDAVVHLAAMGGVRTSVERPVDYLDVNLMGTLNVLEQCRRHGVEHVVFASTSSVYGATTRLPFVESDPCDRPLAPYPASKRAAELIGHSYCHVHGMHFTALRFFTVYGPRGRPDMMPYKILAHLLLGEEVTLYGDGRMVRDWTYVKDIAAGIAQAVDRPGGYQIFNLGRGEPVVVAEFIAEVERQTGRSARFARGAAPNTDMQRTHADVGQARQALGYRPEVSVEEGVGHMLDWFRRAVLSEEPT